MKRIKKLRVCKQWWQHATGLMFSRRKSCLLSFKQPRKVRLHSWFVFYPLDILILDKNKVVAKYALQKWSILRIPGKVKDVLEVPAPSGLKIGDRLEWPR